MLRKHETFKGTGGGQAVLRYNAGRKPAVGRGEAWMKRTKMNMKTASAAILALFALTTSGMAQAADPANTCRLKGGDLVPLPPAACMKEGGQLVKPGTQAAAPAAVKLSSEPKVAAAQKAILEVLGQSVVDPLSSASIPEGVDREVSFDGCKMMVKEKLRIDYGNLFSERRNFNIDSTVDFHTIQPGDFGVMGKIESKGGHLEVPAVTVVVPASRGDKPLTVSVQIQDGKSYHAYTTPALAAYWEGPRKDWWMKDGYGYVWLDNLGYADKSNIRMVYLVNVKGDAPKLKQAMEQMQAACAH